MMDEGECSSDLLSSGEESAIEEDSQQPHEQESAIEEDSQQSHEQESATEEDSQQEDFIRKFKPGNCRLFTEAQRACLNVYYKQGMGGVGKKYGVLIAKAAKDTRLTVVQVKRWIKKKNYRRNHGKRPQSTPIPTKKKPKLTPWQIYLKQYGDTEAGKEAMASGAGTFNKIASKEYKNLPPKERENLKQLSSMTGSATKEMTVKEIKKSASKIFNKIKNQLEKLGYSCVAYGLFEDDVQTAYTRDASCCVSDRIVDYLRSVIIATGDLPPLPASCHEPQNSRSVESSEPSTSNHTTQTISDSLSEEPSLFNSPTRHKKSHSPTWHKKPSSSHPPTDRHKKPSSSHPPTNRYKKPSSSHPPTDRYKKPSSSHPPTDRFKKPSSSHPPTDRHKKPSSSHPPTDRYKKPSVPSSNPTLKDLLGSSKQLSDNGINAEATGDSFPDDDPGSPGIPLQILNALLRLTNPLWFLVLHLEIHRMFGFLILAFT